MGYASYPGLVLQCQESCAGQWSVQWGVWHGGSTLVYHGGFYRLTKCIFKLKAWKADMESKGLHVNIKKTKFLVSGDGQDVFQKSGKYRCAVCCSGVDRNSILCSQYMWVHKKSSGFTQWLVAEKTMFAPGFKVEFWPIDGRTVKRMSTTLSLICKTLSATLVICCAPVGSMVNHM